MRRLVARSVSALAVALIGCSRAQPEPVAAPPPPPPTPPPVALALAVPCADAPAGLDAPPGSLPAFDAGARGEVVRCAPIGHLSASQAKAEIAERGATPPEVATGLTVVRIVYRARRAQAAREASSLAAALVLVPDAPRTELGVVYAHGTVGLADRCAPSRAKPAALPLAFAANGFLTIAPDYAGFGLGAAMHGWMNGEDEARSLFDAARALLKILPSDMTVQKLAFLGNSQGGHAVLAAQALVRADELPLPTTAVVAISPMWFSGALFAAIARDEPTRKDAGERDVLWSLFYFHGHGELFEGPGAGVLGLKKERRGQIAALLDTRCANDLEGDLRGARPSEVYDRAFTDAISTCMANRATCGPITRAWVERMRADQPPPDPKGPPVVFWAGGKDQNVTVGRARCGIDHLRKHGLGPDKLTVCVDPGASHRGVHEKNLGALVAQLAARAGAGPEPPPCPGEAGLDAERKAICAVEGEGQKAGGTR